MGLAISYQIKCDECNDTCIADTSIKLARDTARRSGWIRRHKGRRLVDLCERCAKRYLTFEGSAMNYIRRYYNVPARRRGLVRWEGNVGRILGNSGPHLRVRMIDAGRVVILHPQENGLEYIQTEA